MKSFHSPDLLKLSSLALLMGSLMACNNSPREYQVSITNITHGQPVSPPVALLHKADFSLWKIGEAASDALERMAEGGDGSALLALRDSNPQYQADAPLAPGASIDFSLTTTRGGFNRLSVAGMLVNTNDGFSGINAIELSELKPGQSTVYYSHTYDAGTELNSELTGTIPGPADGGEGYNATRDDVTAVVTLHSGVVSSDDGHMNSTLSSADRFDNPSLKIVVTAL